MFQRQLARDAMVLVEVVALVGEDEVRLEGLQLLEERLDPRPVVREEPVPEAGLEDLLLRRVREHRLGALARLLRALVLAAEDDPADGPDRRRRRSA